MEKGIHIYYSSKFDDEDFNLIPPKKAPSKKQQIIVDLEKENHMINLVVQEKDKQIEKENSMIIEKNKQIDWGQRFISDINDEIILQSLVIE